jgi:hypothetical protein
MRRMGGVANRNSHCVAGVRRLNGSLEAKERTYHHLYLVFFGAPVSDDAQLHF